MFTLSCKNNKITKTKNKKKNKKMKKTLLLIALIILAISELIMKIKPEISFLFYSLLVGSILIVISKIKGKNIETQKKEIALASFLLIIPMMRMIELFINFSFFWRTFIFYNSLLFLVIFYSFKFKIDVGFNTNKLWFLIISMLFGISFGLAGNILSSFIGIEKHLEIIVFLPLIAFTEEILFRSLIQNSLEKNYGDLTGIFVSSLLVLIFTLSYSPWIALFFFLSSLISSALYSYSRNIFPSILLNIIITLLIFVI